MTMAKPGAGWAWIGEERGPQDQHVEPEVGQHPEHARPGATVKQQPLRVLHGVRERGDRGGDLGVLAVCSRCGVAAGAMGDQQRGRDPGRCDGRRQHRQQEVALAGEDADREPDAEDDQRQRVDGGVEKAEVELALGDQLVRHSEAVQDRTLRPPRLPTPRRGAAGRRRAAPRRRRRPSAARGRRVPSSFCGSTIARQATTNPSSDSTSSAIAPSTHSQETCSRLRSACFRAGISFSTT